MKNDISKIETFKKQTQFSGKNQHFKNVENYQVFSEQKNAQKITSQSLQKMTKKSSLPQITKFNIF